MSAPDTGVWCCSNCGAVYHKDYPRCPFDGGEVVLAASDPLEGHRIGNYIIGHLIGEGGMGRVYAAHHANLAAKRYAIKVLLGDVAATSSMRERFTREAESASRLEHPNVVNVLDFGAMDSGLPYLVMDFVDGVRLSTLMDRRMEPARVIRIARAVAGGLAYAHAAGVVHRDLKPDNIMIVTTSDGSEVPRIADFGLATTLDPEASRLTSTGMAMGTPAYAAPEQMAGRRVDHRADVYALGMTMFEMLTGGTLPFEGHPMETAAAKAHREAPRVSDIAPGIRLPDGLEDLIMQMIRRSYLERPADARAVIAALDRIVLDSPVDERAATVADPTDRRERIDMSTDAMRVKRRVPLGVVAALAVGLVGGIGWWAQRSSSGDAVAAEAAHVAPAEPPPQPPPPPAPAADVPRDPPAAPPPRSHDAAAREPTKHPDAKRTDKRDAKPKHVTKHEEPVAKLDGLNPTPGSDAQAKPAHDELMPPHDPNIGSAPPPHDDRPPPPPPAPLVAKVTSVSVHGMSQQLVARAIDRVAGGLKACTPQNAETITVHFTIDESRRPQHVQASSNNCVAATIAAARVEAAPDTGDADVDVTIVYAR